MATCGPAIAQKAQEHPTPRFGHLDAWRNVPCRHECWRAIRQEAADGVDRLRAQDSARHLTANSHHFGERRKRQRDRATLVSRPNSPTGDGQRRPFGIPAVAGQLWQLAVTRLRNAIYEPDCRRCREGDRPPLGALDAVDGRTMQLQCGRPHLVVEADRKGFVDTIEQGWWRRMWAARMADGACLRLRRQGLKAGVRETDGQVLPPATGTPPMGMRAPLLATGALP
jgi:retron-type reverse transcriptase